MDDRSLNLLEFDRVRAEIAQRADSVRARARLAGWRPLLEPETRLREVSALAEAMTRQPEPGEWCHVAAGDLAARLDSESETPLDGPGLVEVREWLSAGRRTRAIWSEEEPRRRWPALSLIAGRLPDLDVLERRLEQSLEPDGTLTDAASPELKRLRGEIDRGERDLERRLARWGQEFGETSYVTRHAERFVVLVPAAGFPRRRALVHDVSGSGQSLFVEPFEACDANNRLIELRAARLEEEHRILLQLANDVREREAEIRSLESALLEFDTLRARARWARDRQAIALAPGGDRLRLLAARHPLLLATRAESEVVPLDLTLEAGGKLLLVSGPNMGGKTVLLKTVGLAALLSHAAFPVPAGEGSSIPELDAVRVDLGDAQSVDQGLSTFAAHLRTLVEMAESAGPRTLLLVDELGAGTDPEEGAALGRALVERFAARGAWGVLTTHLGSLKRVAGEVVGVVNGSLEFDEPTMSSRFRFMPGVPGASHALTVARRLGLPAEVLARARALAPAESQQIERLIAELQETRRRWEAETRSLIEARAAAETAAREHQEATQETRRTLSELGRKLTRESEAILAQARELWQTVQRDARRAEKSRAGAEEIKSRLGAVEREVESLQREARSVAGESAGPESVAPAELKPGMRVRVTDLGVEAEVVSGPDPEGRVQLKRGGWSIQSHVDRLAAISSEGSPRGTHDANVRPRASWEASEEGLPLEVNLLGLDSEDAMRTLDQGLDRAVISGLAELRVVHGVGRGVLRAAVERHLKDHPQVVSQRLGGVGEGGRGVTIARLR